MKRKLLFAAVALLCSVGVWAQDWTGNSVEAGTYYLYNVGADKFLNVGDPNQDWGTNAWLSTNSGFDVTLVASGDNFKIDTNVSNGGDSHYLNNSTWCDGAAVDWIFRAVAGETNVYQIIYNGEYIMANEALNDVEMQGNPAGRTTSTYWKLVTKADRIAALAYATPSNPMDASFLITGANFGRNDGRNDAWTQTKSGGQNKLALGGNNRNFCFESWHTNNFEVSQTITGLPAGKYGLKVQGFYRKDEGDSGKYPYLYLNDSKVTLPLKSGDENSQTAASDAFSAGKYFSEEIKYTYSTGDFKVGTKLEDNGWLWTTFDNFVLTYYGNDCSASIKDADFEGTASDWSGDAPAHGSNVGEHYNKAYDMYQNLTDLTPGIYSVEVQGFYRQGDQGTRGRNEENQNASLYAKGEDNVERSVKLLSLYDAAGKIGEVGNNTVHGYIPNSMAQGASYFAAGHYLDNKVLVEVGAEGTLTVGLKKSTTVAWDWTLFDNFSLTKLPYATLADAYAAEWATKKAEATALHSDGAYSNILTTAAVYTALSSAIAATPSTVDTYVSALAALRTAVNGFKAAKYAYDIYADANTNKSTIYGHITGDELTTFNGITTSDVSDVYTKTPQFTSVKDAYDEYYYENETATRLGADASGVSAPTTAAEATTAAHEINVINYNKFVDEEYADVSETVLGAWTDDNVVERTGQHWSNDGSEKYFEQNEGWTSATVWTMSRQQTVELAAGSYVLKVAARVSAGANAELSVTVGSGEPIVTYAPHHGDTGKGIDTSGAANFADGTFANTNGRGFEWRYIPFSLNSDGEVTLKFFAENTSGNLHQYVSFCNLGIWTDPKVAARTELLTAINNATAALRPANEGTGIFQYPVGAGATLTTAITTAQSVYDNDDAVLSEINTATTAMTTAQTTYEGSLNAPTTGKRYRLILQDKGALTFQTASTEGNYGLPFMTAGDYMAQDFVLTKVSGNMYFMSFRGFDGNVHYICTRAAYGEGGTGTVGIRTTTTMGDLLPIIIEPTNTAGVFNMLNTANDNAKLGSNGGDFYTDNAYTSWTIEEASQAEVTVSCKAGKYGTVIFPFTPDVSTGFDGITFYSCESVNNVTEKVQIVEEPTPAANVPYLIKNDNGSDFRKDLTGWGTAGAESYTVGLLTGVYTTAAVPENSYVLQTPTSGENEGVQAFYKVSGTFNATANKCYLTYEAPNQAHMLKLFFGEDETTGINGLTPNPSPESEGSVQVYDLQGRKVQNPKRGMYIINGKVVVVK